jgi:Kef-type K+ transport system membrane component KefB
LKLLYISLIVFVFNIPFGYWRNNVKKFSLQWILAIHIPVPFIIGLRFLSGLGFQFITYPALVGGFFAGQFLGSKIHSWRMKNLKIPITSCLIYDLYSILKNNL